MKKIALALLFFCLLIPALFSAQNPDDSSLSSSALKELQADAASPLPNRIKVLVAPEAVFDPKSEKTLYRYSLTSLPDSQQVVDAFFLIYKPKLPYSLENPQTPKHWFSFRMDMGTGNHPHIYWGSDYVDVKSPPYRLPKYGIQPGKQLSGFSFTSNALPEIGNFYVQGSIRNWIPKGQASAKKITPKFPDDSFKTQALIPFSAPPQSFDFSAFKQKMAGFINQSAQLGWIKTPNTQAALLDSLSKIFSSGRSSARRQHLKQFLRLLETERGKTINDSAYYLLKVNAQYLGNRLKGKKIPAIPQPPKPQPIRFR